MKCNDYFYLKTNNSLTVQNCTSRLRLHQVGVISSRKNIEVKHLGPQLALRWVTIQGGCYKYRKIPEVEKPGASIICFRGKKKL